MIWYCSGINLGKNDELYSLIFTAKFSIVILRFYRMVYWYLKNVSLNQFLILLNQAIGGRII